MPRRFDLGIASYANFEKLHRTVATIRRQCVTDWRLLIVDNPSPQSDQIRKWICAQGDQEPRISVVMNEENRGYAGAVNQILEWAETEYIGYCDNDVMIDTRAWDESLCSLLDRHHEVGMVFPNGGAFPIHRGTYTEVLWGIGFCWVINRMAFRRVGGFDEAIGHQEEADYCMRMRMKGYRCASLGDVRVRHDATATKDPKALERINAGVERFVTKWNRYFNGEEYHYHHPYVTRWEDWPPNALYLEQFYRTHLGDKFNENPELITLAGRKLDLIKVPRFFQMYRNRII